MSSEQVIQQTNSTQQIKTIGVAAAGTFIGIGAMLLMQNYDKNQEKEKKLERIRQRKKRYLEKKAMQEFVNDARKNANDIQNDKPKRRVNLYFDENDQMVERNEDEELAKELERQDLKSGKADPHLNIDQLKHKLKFI